MRFLESSQLLWGLLVAVAAALYLFRPRPRTVPVSTLLFFKSLAREHQESAWLRRLKRLLSFLLSAGVLLGAAGALARPVISPPAESLRQVVVLVDRSASMAARDGAGRTRLEEAVARAGDRLDGLPAGVGVMIMAYDARPEILLPRTRDRREAERALASIRPRPIEGNSGEALRLAARFAALDVPAAVWHATDGPAAGIGSPRSEVRTSKSREPDDRPSLSGPPKTAVPDPEPGTLNSELDLPPGVSLETPAVPLVSPVNAGITAFRLRRLPLERARFEAFVQIHGAAAAPLEAELEVRVDGTLASVRKMTIEPGGSERLLLPVEAGVGKILSLRVSARGDALPLDDEVVARIPEIRPVKVLWIATAPDPFTGLALLALGRDGDIQVFRGGPQDWPPQFPVDVVLFDGWLPDAWPTGTSAVVINPPGPLGPVRAARIAGDGLPLDAVRATEERHPLLYGVASGRIALTQTVVLDADGPLEPLWIGPSGPVLLAGEVRGQRIAVLGFAPGRSERLPLMASYPMLIGNAIYWAVQPGAGAHDGNRGKTGDLVALEGKTLTWTPPGAEGPAQETVVPLPGRWAELDRVGLWRTDAGETGSAALLSRRETVLPAAPAGPDPSGAGAATASVLRGDLAAACLWIVLVLLVAESWLFHRRSVY